MIGRRTFLGGVTAAASAAVAAALPAPAVAKNRLRLMMATTWPKNFPGLGTCAERVAKRLDEASDGRITVRVFAAGELVPAFEAFDAVATGTADMYHGGEYYWQGKSAAYNFFSAIPFGLTATERSAWLRYGGGQELWDELSGRFNVKPLLCGSSGVQMGGWFSREINTMEDFRGLKFRIPGIAGEVLRRAGAATVSMSATEIFPALQSGAIDAVEWVGPWNDLVFGFHKIAKYYYWPGFHEPGSSLALGINRKLWEDLPAADRVLLETVCGAETERTLAEFNANNAKALEVLIKKHKVALRRFPDEVLIELGRMTGEVLKEIAAADDLSRRIYDSFLAQRNRSMAWARISDYAIEDARRLPIELG